MTRFLSTIAATVVVVALSTFLMLQAASWGNGGHLRAPKLLTCSIDNALHNAAPRKGSTHSPADVAIPFM